MPELFVGIDPGLYGAVAEIHATGELQFHDTPIYQDGKRARIDALRSAQILRQISESDEAVGEHCQRIIVVIEKAQPSRVLNKKGDVTGGGTVSSFSSGYGFGIWVGILAALQISYHFVTPQAWKKELMNGEPKEKDASRIVCDRIWPGQRENWWPLKKHHGRCDALLMAEYGRRKFRHDG